jgi:hypothetical protein
MRYKKTSLKAIKKSIEKARETGSSKCVYLGTDIEGDFCMWIKNEECNTCTEHAIIKNDQLISLI